MQIFDDIELNRKANEIKDAIEAITIPMNAINALFSGQSMSNIDPDAASRFMRDLQDNGLHIVRKLLNDTLSNLNYIKSRRGSRDKAYIEFSEVIALTGSEIIKMYVGPASVMTMATDFSDHKLEVQKVKSDLSEATRVMAIISTLEMSSDAKHLIDQTINIINAAEKRVRPKSGCFIATCIYGSYNSSEVLILRSFRDDTLSHYYLGKLFIHVYYYISPGIAKMLSKSSLLNSIGRFLLDRIVSFLVRGYWDYN